MVENLIDAKPTALGEFNSPSEVGGLSVIPLSSNGGVESLSHPIRIRESFNRPGFGYVPVSAIPYHRQKRALVFRPLFVYRQQELRRERLRTSTRYPRTTQYRPTQPIYKYYNNNK